MLHYTYNFLNNIAQYVNIYNKQVQNYHILSIFKLIIIGAIRRFIIIYI